MLWKVLFSHRLVSGNILAIDDISLSHLLLPIRLSLFHLLHLSGRPGRQRVKDLLIGGFIIDLFVSEIKMSLPQLMFHLDVVLVSLARSGPAASVRRYEIGAMRCLLRVADLRVTDREMRLLDLLCNLFIQLGLVHLYVAV